MCGISGIVSYNGIMPEDKQAVADMMRHLRHRGPDSQDLTALNLCVLGHNRLAVLDLSDKARQPMWSADGRYIMVFNGEIYNFKTLRRELELSGHVFRTTSDSEVLLEYFAIHGPSCLPLLNGMFAFAIWDTHQHSLFLAKDRFGQKPLYYSEFYGRFVFSSEVLPIFNHSMFKKSPNLNAIYHYLTLQSIPAPLTAFENAYKLPPAHFLKLYPFQELSIQRYWNPKSNPKFLGSNEEAEEELDLRLRNAVSRHLVSDVPVGVFLSGGVDSSLVTALCPSNISAFCVQFSEANFDESPFAAQAAQHCGITLTSLRATADLGSLLPDMIHHFGEPFADSSALATWMLCASARQHVTVALSGDGGDDLFNGYARHTAPFLLADGLVSDDVMRKLAELKHCFASVPEAAPWADRISPAVANYLFQISYFCGAHKRQLCRPELLEAASPSLSSLLFSEAFEASRPSEMLDAIRFAELDNYLASTLMPKVDITAMASSLEVRMPLLDIEVADFALSLPASMRVRRVKGKSSFGNPWEGKWLLKKVASRYLPDSLIYRRKKGFSIPLTQWLRDPLADMVKDLLLASDCLLHNWIYANEIKRIVAEHLSGRNDHRYRLWSLLILELWARKCLK